MSSLTGFVKRIRDIMWNDAGVNGDAQRIEQMAWILFLKVYNTKEEEWRYTDRPYTSIIPEECRWNNWAADDKSGKAMTGDTLLDFVNNKLFPTLKGLNVTAATPIKKAIVKTTLQLRKNCYLNLTFTLLYACRIAFLHRTPLSRQIFCSSIGRIPRRKLGSTAWICRKDIRTSPRRSP